LNSRRAEILLKPNTEGSGVAMGWAKSRGPSSSHSREVTKRRRGKERVEWGRGPWRAVLAFRPRAPEFQVMPLTEGLMTTD